MTAVTVAMLFSTAGMARKHGTKKTLVRWIILSMAAYSAMYIFMMSVNTLAITKMT